MSDQDPVADAEVVEHRETVLGHQGRSNSVAAEGGLPVPTLVKGDHLVAEVDQGLRHHVPHQQRHAVAVG